MNIFWLLEVDQKLSENIMRKLLLRFPDAHVVVIATLHALGIELSALEKSGRVPLAIVAATALPADYPISSTSRREANPSVDCISMLLENPHTARVPVIYFVGQPQDMAQKFQTVNVPTVISNRDAAGLETLAHTLSLMAPA